MSEPWLLSYVALVCESRCALPGQSDGVPNRDQGRISIFHNLPVIAWHVECVMAAARVENGWQGCDYLRQQVRSFPCRLRGWERSLGMSPAHEVEPFVVKKGKTHITEINTWWPGTPLIALLQLPTGLGRVDQPPGAQDRHIGFSRKFHGSLRPKIPSPLGVASPQENHRTPAPVDGHAANLLRNQLLKVPAVSRPTLRFYST